MPLGYLGPSLATEMDGYLVLKYVHVLLAIVAVGFNASYGIWLARAAREPAHLGHVLRGIKTLDDRFANPAYALLLVTGLGMTFVTSFPLTTRWILSSLALYAVLLVVGNGPLEAERIQKEAHRQGPHEAPQSAASVDDPPDRPVPWAGKHLSGRDGHVRDPDSICYPVEDREGIQGRNGEDAEQKESAHGHHYEGDR